MAFARAAYLFAPLLIASALSGVVLRFDLWQPLRRPIDRGLAWRGQRVLGDSKTWRGVVVAMVGCMAGVAVQALAGDRVGSVAIVDYHDVRAVPFAIAMGLGATLGELPNSFAKRRLGIAPGTTTSGGLAIVFYVWDQVDLLTGAWPLIAIWVPLELEVILASFALVLVLHPTVSLIGFLVGARTSAR